MMPEPTKNQPPAETAVSRRPALRQPGQPRMEKTLHFDPSLVVPTPAVYTGRAYFHKHIAQQIQSLQLVLPSKLKDQEAVKKEQEVAKAAAKAAIEIYYRRQVTYIRPPKPGESKQDTEAKYSDALMKACTEFYEKHVYFDAQIESEVQKIQPEIPLDSPLYKTAVNYIHRYYSALRVDNKPADTTKVSTEKNAIPGVAVLRKTLAEAKTVAQRNQARQAILQATLQAAATQFQETDLPILRGVAAVKAIFKTLYPDLDVAARKALYKAERKALTNGEVVPAEVAGRIALEDVLLTLTDPDTTESTTPGTTETATLAYKGGTDRFIQAAFLLRQKAKAGVFGEHKDRVLTALSSMEQALEQASGKALTGAAAQLIVDNALKLDHHRIATFYFSDEQQATYIPKLKANISADLLAIIKQQCSDYQSSLEKQRKITKNPTVSIEEQAARIARRETREQALLFDHIYDTLCFVDIVDLEGFNHWVEQHGPLTDPLQAKTIGFIRDVLSYQNPQLTADSAQRIPLTSIPAFVKKQWYAAQLKQSANQDGPFDTFETNFLKSIPSDRQEAIRALLRQYGNDLKPDALEEAIVLDLAAHLPATVVRDVMTTVFDFYDNVEKRAFSTERFPRYLLAIGQSDLSQAQQVSRKETLSQTLASMYTDSLASTSGTDTVAGTASSTSPQAAASASCEQRCQQYLRPQLPAFKARVAATQADQTQSAQLSADTIKAVAKTYVDDLDSYDWVMALKATINSRHWSLGFWGGEEVNDHKITTHQKEMLEAIDRNERFVAAAIASTTATEHQPKPWGQVAAELRAIAIRAETEQGLWSRVFGTRAKSTTAFYKLAKEEGPLAVETAKLNQFSPEQIEAAVKKSWGSFFQAAKPATDETLFLRTTAVLGS